jgi:hypothetical protein
LDSFTRFVLLNLRKKLLIDIGASMKIERLGLFFLLQYFNHLGDIKDHLLSALREILLAVQSSVDIVLDTAKSAELSPHLEKANVLVEKVNSVLDFTIEKVTPKNGLLKLSEKELQILKESLIQSIITSLDEEINLCSTSSREGKIKIEALNTVKKSLRGQIKSDEGIRSVKIA